MTASEVRKVTPGSRRSRRRLVPALTAAVMSLNPLCPDAAWATCDGSPTTAPYPPETGTAGPDVMEGDDQPNTIYGGAGNDLICGNEDADSLYGEAGNDDLIGG